MEQRLEEAVRKVVAHLIQNGDTPEQAQEHILNALTGPVEKPAATLTPGQYMSVTAEKTQELAEMLKKIPAAFITPAEGYHGPYKGVDFDKTMRAYINLRESAKWIKEAWDLLDEAQRNPQSTACKIKLDYERLTRAIAALEEAIDRQPGE